MSLKKFNTDTVPAGMRGTRATEPGFGIYYKTGQMNFNASACELIGLNAGDQLEFAQDDENPMGWFLTKVKEKGFVLKDEKKGKTLRAVSCGVARAILASAKVPQGKGGRIKIVPKQIKLQGALLWPLDLSPLKSK